MDKPQERCGVRTDGMDLFWLMDGLVGQAAPWSRSFLVQGMTQVIS